MLLTINSPVAVKLKYEIISQIVNNMNGNTRRDKYVVIYGANRFRSESNARLKDYERHRSTGNKHIFIFVINFANTAFGFPVIKTKIRARRAD